MQVRDARTGIQSRWLFGNDVFLRHALILELQTAGEKNQQCEYLRCVEVTPRSYALRLYLPLLSWAASHVTGVQVSTFVSDSYA